MGLNFGPSACSVSFLRDNLTIHSLFSDVFWEGFCDGEMMEIKLDKKTTISRSKFIGHIIDSLAVAKIFKCFDTGRSNHSYYLP